jgi:hypothetical protein
VLFLVPDLSMLGYLSGPQIGAVSYNLFHTYAPPGLLAAFGLLSGSSLLLSVALVWFSHIGFDRMVGFGLKYPTGLRPYSFLVSFKRFGNTTKTT